MLSGRSPSWMDLPSGVRLQPFGKRILWAVVSACPSKEKQMKKEMRKISPYFIRVYLKSGLAFSLITVNENFRPVVAAALVTAVVVSNKLLLSAELKTREDPDFPGLFAGLKKYFFNSWDNFA